MYFKALEAMNHSFSSHNFKPSDQILLILDLDETLIYSSTKELSREADFHLFQYYIYKRPYLTEFLDECAQHFKLAIWSSASDDDVEAVIKQIIPPAIKLEFVWGRNRCTYCLDAFSFEDAGYSDFQSHYFFIKVLKKVKKRGFKLEKVLIIDDTPSKAKRNYGNVIYPQEYMGEADDNELKLLLAYLLQLKDVDNVRAIEKRNWRN
jgi:carboxy-terminal domain RNA polymerase II polypeptide A small phosphatase